MTLPRIIPMDTREAFAELPILDVIKEQSPAQYKRMMVPVDRATRNNKMSQTVLNDFRVVYFELIEEKVRKASAANLRDLERISIS